MFAMLLSSEADLRPVSEEDATFVELHMHFSSSNFSFARVDTGRWLRTTKLLLEGKYEQIFKQEHEQDDEPIIQASLSSSTSRCRTTSTDEARAVHDVVEESRASGASDSEKSRIPSSSSKGSSTLDDLDLSMRHIMDTLRTHREEVAIREARKAQALAIRNRFPTKKRALAYTSFTGAAAFAGSLAATQQELLLVADALVAFAHPHVALLVTAWRQLLQWFLSTSVGVYIARTVLGETTSASAQPAFVVFILENFINPLVSAVAAVGRALGLFSKPEPTAFEQFLLYLLELYRYARIFVLDITEAEFLAEQVGSMNKHQRQGFALLGIGIFFVYIGILRVAYSGIKHSARKHQQLELHDKTK
ncbi:unnamed protein product [Amoebophrya sp. A25]|nr:unnamed protein product [Amoebophrya sp. A25]|eukprot:GSA25T00009522001.1